MEEIATRNEAGRPLPDDETCWTAVVNRDRSADGSFYYSVRTTGVYCRPSCAARRPRRDNVAFHPTAADAERAGFRPCKRCKPDQAGLTDRYAALIADSCQRIESAEQPPTLEELAGAAGMSTFHFHRVFKATVGVTPKKYADAARARRVREELTRPQSVTDAIYNAGFNSNGRFYSAAPGVLGMTPTEFRAGGSNTTIRFAVGECSLGSVTVAASDRGICAILLGDDPEALVRELQDMFPNAELVGGDPAFEQLIANAVGLVERPSHAVDLPLDIRGTAFQQRVWQALREIPLGSTASYKEIAERIGQPTATRAVARACASNMIAVAIPCHRVVRSDGGLSGYRWGVERKRTLLARESEQAYDEERSGNSE